MRDDIDHDEQEFTGRTAIVTGAGGGIGRGIADGLRASGARVAYVDINQELLGDLPRSESVLPLVADIARSESIGAAVAAVVERWSTVDILVNSAAISTPHIALQLPPETWQRVIDVNLSGTFYADLAVAPYMRRQGYGRIVNVASVAARRISFNGNVAYTASKAGVLGLTRHLAFELARDGITVNAICPGATLTPLMERLADEEVLAARAKTMPIGRLCVIDDFVAAVRYLASSAASGVTGAVLDVDGGSLLGWTDTDSYFRRRDELTARFEEQKQ